MKRRCFNYIFLIFSFIFAIFLTNNQHSFANITGTSIYELQPTKSISTLYKKDEHANCNASKQENCIGTTPKNQTDFSTSKLDSHFTEITYLNYDFCNLLNTNLTKNNFISEIRDKIFLTSIFPHAP